MKKSVQGDYEPVFRGKKQTGYQTVFSRRHAPFTFGLAVFVFLFVVLQRYGAYHFYYIEQEQLFLYSRPYLFSVWMQPAGLVRLLAEFGIQHFINPYWGAFLMSALFTCIGMQTGWILKRIAPHANIGLLSLLPVATLLYVHSDTNYSYSGTVAYSLMLMALHVYFCINNTHVRAVYALFISAILFWWAGAVAFLFAVCIFLWELLNRFTQSYRFIFPLLLVTALAFYSVYNSLAGDYRYMILPDGYFTSRLRPGFVIYLSWICLPALLLLASVLRKRDVVRKNRNVLGMFLQILVIAAVFGYGMKKFVNPKSEFYKELSHYMRMEQWDKIIERCEGSLTNYLYKCCLNIALAEKNELAERMFSFDQQGEESIYLPWSRESHISVLLSDLFFSMGYISNAQRMAFEANECTPSAGNPRTIKRLIQTNLLFGAYPVAEKYISLLEQTNYYREWAQAQRRFLWNDEALEKDSILGLKRKCIPKTNYTSAVNSLNMILRQIAVQNPAHTATIQYAGANFLLIKDLESFKELIDTCYGTEVLPILPKSFQEAVIILSEQNPSYVESFHLSESTLRRYRSYRQQVLANKQRAALLPGLLKTDFGDTYWYYYMFNNIQ
ncbi:MAG: DUF6057 family protein [Tannerella sp.]|nr:DUF6057 family protein [Tannerella sp.]